MRAGPTVSWLGARIRPSLARLVASTATCFGNLQTVRLGAILSLPMPIQPYPVCGVQPSRHLHEESLQRYVNIYSCPTCGHIWTIDKADPSRVTARDAGAGWLAAAPGETVRVVLLATCHGRQRPSVRQRVIASCACAALASTVRNCLVFRDGRGVRWASF